jgi:hypothetical protein
VREFLVVNAVEVVATKIGRTPSSVKHLCSRLGIRTRELRCDLFSVNGLATAMHVRKAEILVWIERGWLEAVREDEASPVPTRFLPRPFSAAYASTYQIYRNAIFAVRTSWPSSNSIATCPSTL